MKPKIVLFDIDGTLLLTGGAGKIAIERAFGEICGKQDVWGGVIPDGKTDPQIFLEIAQTALSKNLDPDELDALSGSYLHWFEHEIRKAEKFRLMPGVAELLETLSQQRGIFLGIATGNYEQAAWAKLDRGGLKHYFKFGGFGSDSADRAELTCLAAERGRKHAGQDTIPEVFVVGDSVHDVRAAKKIGAVVISVETGSTPEAVLREETPHYHFQDLCDISKFMRVLGVVD
ncbi:MAG: hypothetical protein A2Z83_02330 [Omnitrophica bacterium GWA2_52_8]|nr:MAG: hypothetical protein A2Z83_02330 [Omnitrophica bacterium GWA2_52_8]